MRGALAIAAAALLLGAALGARAQTTVSFVWTGTTGAGTPGGVSIDAAPGDLLTGEIRIDTADPTGIAAYGISLAFDADLGDELDLESVTELLPAGFTHNLTPGPQATHESTAAGQGAILTVEALSLAGGTGMAYAVAAEVVFRVTANVATDGTDVSTGILFYGVDAIGNGGDDDITSTATFQGASVDRLAAVPAVSPWLWLPWVLGIGSLGLAATVTRSRPARP